MAFGGLRIGELAGLQVQDFDEVHGTLHVRRSLKEVAGRVSIGDPKTQRSVRKVPLPAFLRDRIAEHITTYPPGPGGHIFTGARGSPLRPNNFRKRVLTPAAKRAGLIEVTPHALRHTAASLMRSVGAPIEAVAKRLGHSRSSVTLDVYSHLYADEDDRITKALDRLSPGVSPGEVSDPDPSRGESVS